MRKIFELHGEITIDGINVVSKALKQLDEQLLVITKSSKKLGDSFEKIGSLLTKAITFPATAVTTALGAAAIKTADFADKILDLSQTSGMSTDALQKWNYAITKTGGNFNEFANMLNKVNGRIPEFINNNTLANRILRQLGISLYDTNGKLKSMDILLPEIIDGLQSINNITERNVAAYELFGMRFDELIAIVGEGREEFNKLLKEAEDLNIVISKANLQAANNLGMAVNELKLKFYSLWQHIATQIIPVLLDLYDVYKEKLYKAIDSFANGLKNAIEYVKNLDEGTKNFYETLAKIGIILVASGPVMSGLGALLKTLASIKVLIASIGTVISASPILIFLGGIVAMGASLIATEKNLNKLNDALQFKNAERTKGLLEELRYNLKQLDEQMGMSENGMIYYMGDPKKYEEITSNIKKIKKELGELGIDIEGDIITQLNKVNELLEENNNKTEENTNLQKKNIDITKEKIKNVNEELELEKELIDLEIEMLEEQLKEEERLKEENRKWDEEYTAKMLKYDKEVAEAKKALEYAKINTIRDTTEKELALLEQRQKEEIEKYKENEEALTLIKEKHAIERAEIEKRIEQRKNEQLKEMQKEFVNTLMYEIDLLYNIMNEYYTSERIKIDNNYKKEKERIEKTVKDKKEKEDLLLKLEEQTEAKRREILRKQATIDKAMSIFNIFLKTQEAIMTVWKTFAGIPPVAIALSSTIGALGATLAGMVAARPIPAAEGLFVPKRKGGVLLQVGEGGDDELVLPMKKGAEILSKEIVKEVSNTTNTQIHLHIGTLIADEQGLKKLWKELNKIQITEATRRGALI